MNLIESTPKNKMLVLGTALWGWGITKETAFSLLEMFFELGGTIIDTATNYPINKKAEDFGLAVNWISEWLNSGNTGKLRVFAKVGAINNSGDSLPDLAGASIQSSLNLLREKLGSSLAVLAIHWDNRGETLHEYAAIVDTIEAMKKFYSEGLQIGFSGVQHPEFYLKAAPEFSDKWWIQVKENAVTNMARLKYEKFFPNAKYLAYGINMAGLKSELPTENSSLRLRGITYSHEIAQQLTNFIKSEHKLEPMPNSFNELALLRGYLNPALTGIVIAPRNLEQLENTMNFWGKIRQKQSEI